jgi:mono/diheme cytochrome c family protein/plastocyanin
MTDDPARQGQETLPVPSEPAGPPDVSRFSSPPQARRSDLTPARAAQIVTSSASARWIGFIATIVVVLFTIGYYFYEVGLPLDLSTPRLEAEASAQAVTAVERGYNVYQANCARCHGVDGEGGIGPVLNDQSKLFWHLTPEYLETILVVGGRYACGNADSLMPIWSDQGSPPGPLNYRQIEELIAYLRAPSDEEFVVRNEELFTPEIDPETGEVETFTGWVDPAYQPEPGATPFPDCYLDKDGTPAPSPTPPASLPPGTLVLPLVAQNIAFEPLELKAAAGEDFVIELDQRDTGVGGHDVDIEMQDGTVLRDNPVVTDPAVVPFQIQALEAGTYVFQCSVHPIPSMTGTLIVETK